MDKFVVMTSAAKMPTSCWGRYRNVAVVELEEGFTDRPKMISTHARGVKRIVEHFGPQFVGKTSLCAYGRTLREARLLAEKLSRS